MKTKHIFLGLVAMALVSVSTISCEGYEEDLITELNTNREFAPIGLKAIVRNQTTAELNWTANEKVDHYVVEFSADDPDFNTIFKTVNVLATELPVRVALEGETLYSIRVKAVSATGKEDSKWSVTTVNTLSEQLFLPVQAGDINAKEAIFRWVANSTVTEIVCNPGTIKHTITAQEKIDGFAKVTGLTPETNYTVDLMNGTKKRGAQVITTGIDIGNGILVKPTDDLAAVVAAAESGATLVLEPGTYAVFTGEILITKSITIRGLKSYDKPKLNLNFQMKNGAANFSLIDLDLTGTGLVSQTVITFADAATTYSDVLISGCYIHDYTKGIVYGNGTGSKVASFEIDNSIIKEMNNAASADLIDFRNTQISKITIKTSTFVNCSAGRDFVRVDAASGQSGTGLTTTTLIENNTLNNVSSITGTTPKRLLYVRFVNNISVVKNNIVANTNAVWANQAATTIPTYSSNYYFNAPSCLDAAITANKPDSNGTVADPGFANAAGGDFTISNQTMIDNRVGDPRWIK